MRKYTTLFAAVILLLTKATAQSVGINNNTPHASAALDVTSTTKGVLIPRLTQAERLDIASPAKGLLVFDSSSNSFWYHNGSAWQEVGSGTNTWNLTGNSGTDTTVNFIGTTDAQPIIFKVSNTRSGHIDWDPTSGNTGFGYQALFFNSGTNNTANGFQSLYANSSGFSNTAGGREALYANTTGYWNAAHGFQALYSNTTGNSNAANGFGALYFNTTGSSNTANGVQSLFSNTTGSSNTALGASAGVSTGNLTNATAIGSNAIVDASNKVRVGNTSVTSIGGQVGWTTFSDGRYKKNIKDDVKGLAFIISLKPITYTVDIDGLNTYFAKGRKQDGIYEKMKKDMHLSADAAAKIVYNGFIAQDVELAAKKLNYDFNGVDKPQTKDGLYGLRYADFVVPLVKAVQELSKINDEKDIRLNELENRLAKLETLLAVQPK